MKILEYDLPDGFLFREPPSSCRLLIWRPEMPLLTLGFSNSPERSLYINTAETDSIPIYRRPSGGEAVLLTPAMLGISLSIRKSRSVSPYPFFKTLTRRILTALQALGVESLSLEGISDIALSGRKICGAAIYQNRDIIFFHAVLNLSENPGLFSRYLRHPPREPAWRRGRPHEQFITSLHNEGYLLAIPGIRRELIHGLGMPPA